MSPKLADVPTPFKKSMHIKRFLDNLQSLGTFSLLMEEIYAFFLVFWAWFVGMEMSLAHLLSDVTAVSTWLGRP